MSGALQAVFQNQRAFTAPPVNTVAPVVSGTATFGQTLTTTNGTWTGLPAPTFTYQWQRVTTNISGATSSTYVLVAADVGNTIRCVVTATNAISAVSANSNSTASVVAAVPGAPTIGTATATSATTATVAYTAPASNGGATITLYTATSSPSSITGTLATAGSGTITVSGLAGSTSYTFTVKATNSAGQSAASSASNSITTLPVIGSALGGGFFAGQISTAGNGIADYNLVVGPIASTQSTLRYKTTATSDIGASSNIAGPTNSANINDANHPAAQFCEGLTVGGFSDWYMPAKNELEVCYYNLKPTTENNATNNPYGINPNSVPARAIAYTAGTPAQTSAADFKDTGTEDYDQAIYWTSTQATNGAYAFNQLFTSGIQTYSNKATYSFKVRAIRRVAV